MGELRIEVDKVTHRALVERAERTGADVDALVNIALRDFLDIGRHTVFQISTAGALVEGLLQGAASIGEVRRHGDLGLGTFEGLDGEMIVLDGEVYRVDGDGRAAVVDDDVRTPFALVTRFERSDPHRIGGGIDDLPALAAAIDGIRESDNAFCAIRVEGAFAHVRTRSTCAVRPGIGLVAAAASQHEFDLEDVTGTMLGFWSPSYTGGLEVAGYHLHFLTADRRAGGHVLGCRADSLDVELQLESALHLAFPETPAFLAADFRHDPGAALAAAEHDPRPGPVTDDVE